MFAPAVPALPRPVMSPPLENQVPLVAAPAVPALPRPVMLPLLENQVPHVAAAAIEPVDDVEEGVVPVAADPLSFPQICAVCLSQRSTHMVAPCGHMCLCDDCANALPRYQANPHCPLCKNPTVGAFRVFKKNKMYALN
ncbi:E3 ubiquitin ligase Rnf157-like [Homalodisca vitripennis]|uniref:E3 ubiquitin ligase Rnf157-like n=1 Tax=Homalodisca vitripennis TaxID=197043 RepID=UPI001EECB29E|nr:E3 ubiquitin ligase Rnf157-like [Homalodisca vitripennis]